MVSCMVKCKRCKQQEGTVEELGFNNKSLGLICQACHQRIMNFIAQEFEGRC